MGKQWKKDGKIESAQKKGRIFTKIAREVYVATKLGGADPEANPRLKLALNLAKQNSVPKDTIDRAIKRGSGEDQDDTQYEELVYEGYGPHQVGILVTCQTENRNRTITDIRTIFYKNGGTLGESGSVMWMFDRVGLVEAKIDRSVDLEEEAIEAEADDVETQNSNQEAVFYTSPEHLDQLRSRLVDRGWEISAAELGFRPKNITDVTAEQRDEVATLLEALDDNDDTSRIYSTVAATVW